MLPGVLNVELNRRIGTVLITYRQPATGQGVQAWISRVTELCLAYLRKADLSALMNEEKLAEQLRQLLRRQPEITEEGMLHDAEN